MRLVKVNSPDQERLFLQVAVELYSSDIHWVRPLDDEINRIFSKKGNKLFEAGDACRWILYKEDNLIGRIAAFHSELSSFKEEFPLGGIGFFECVNNQEAGFLLFDTAKKWLQQEGMEAMDGPINFGERNAWWGCMVKGFFQPAYMMPYNPPYYQKFFEDYGFKLYFKQFTYGLNTTIVNLNKYEQRSLEIFQNTDYTFRHINNKEKQRNAQDFIDVYNAAWKEFPSFQGMKIDSAIKLLKKLNPILIDYLVWFGYYKGKAIAMFIMLPDLNEYFKYVNGKMNLIGKMKFLYHKIKGTNRRLTALIFGIAPEHRAMNVESGLIMTAKNQVIPKNRWDNLEMYWQGDFNPKINKISENLGSEITRIHHTYRYNFDSNRKFERHPILD